MTTEVVKTIRASGGDYTTLSAWEAALPASLVTNDEQHTAVCYNDWPSGLGDAVTISGSVVDATRYIKVTVAEGHRHDGTTNHTGFYLKGDKGSNNAYFQNDVQRTVMEWLDIEHTRNANSASALRSTTSFSIVRNTIGKCASTSLTTIGIAANGTSNTESEWAIVENCLAINAQHGFRNQSDLGRLRAKYYNNTAVGCSIGFPGAAAVPGIAINCVAYDCATDWNGSWHASSDYNASSDTSANVFAHYVTGVDSSDFVDASGGDFHLASGSALIGAGVNLIGEFDHDIDGDIRPSSGAWDIGFDHYASAASAVYSDLADAYTLRAAASGDLTDSYAVRAAITQDLADSYSVRAAIAQDLADSYTITASVAADASDSYVIRAAITQDLADSYALRAAIAQDLADSYSIESAGTVTSDLFDGYVIRAATTSDLADSYGIRAAVTADLSDAANIRAAVAADIEDAYTIVAAVAADLVDTALIRAAATADLADNYTIAAQPGACPSADTIAEAVWAHATGTAVAVRLAEAWGRLGLDPSKPLVSGQTEISFGDIAMALTGNETSSTLTRQ